MVVVIGIIVRIVAMVVPAVSTLWAEQKMSQAINTMQGLLMTTRIRALQSAGPDTGFFVFVDEQGNQRIVEIEQPKDHLADEVWQNVFVITDARDHQMPSPIRIVPRYVVDDSSGAGVQAYDVFDKDELANNDFYTTSLPGAGDQAQRHRNFFSVIYSTDGELVVNRDVLILDRYEDNSGLGDRTGLPVGDGPNADDPSRTPTVDKYYKRDGTDEPIDLSFGPTPIEFLVRDPESSNETAINFPSVDGLLVYDDSSFNGMPDAAAKRQLLLNTAQPLYVSRYTGMVIRGPIGENN